MQSSRWISRRVLGRVQPEVFFAAERFECQEAVGEHDQCHVMIPTDPTATFIVIQAKFLLQLLVVLLDLPSGFGDLHQSAKTIGGSQIAEEVLRRLRSCGGPLNQQPDLFACLAALVKSMGGLHPACPEA